MKRQALLTLGSVATLVLAAQPAWAFEWTLPASFNRLSLANQDGHHDTLGLQVPVLWLGGPIGPFALHFALGYAYQQEIGTGQSVNFATGTVDFDLEAPLKVVVPYVGAEGMAWYPINPPSFIQGVPLMIGPHAGIRFDLGGLVGLDLSAFGYPFGTNLFNVRDASGKPYTSAQSWGVEAKLSLNL